MKEKEFLPLVSQRLGIESLNEMQTRMMRAASEARNIILISPTGSGKTLAFTLTLLKWLNPAAGKLQAVIIAPSRELVIQIGSVIKEIAAGYKVSVLYGGHKVEDEVNTLSVTPDIVVATPGRLLDHLKRGNIDPSTLRIVVLDEFDKSMELGFEEDMRKILFRLKNVSRIILTSATKAPELPAFLKLESPLEINYLPKEQGKTRRRMRVFGVRSDANDKLESLRQLLLNLAAEVKGEDIRTIVFVNHRESAERVAGFLRSRGVDAALYHGALDQRGREQAITAFNNGSASVLVATDLAARGLDIEGVKNIVHYHQPLTSETYTHRNGRTARVDAEGDIYVLLGPDEEVKPYVDIDNDYHMASGLEGEIKGKYETISFAAGRKEKLSKSDILGFLTKECGIPGNEIGKITIFDHYALAAVSPTAADSLNLPRNMKIKGKSQRVTLCQ